MASTATGMIRTMSLPATELTSYSEAARPVTPLATAPDRRAAVVSAARTAGVAFMAAVLCWFPARSAAANRTVRPSPLTY